MEITPYILGSGRSAQAMTEAFSILNIVRPQFQIHDPKKIARDTRVNNVITSNVINPVLCIANPHGLHASTILDAAQDSRFSLIITEKPAAVTLGEVAKLKEVRTPTAVCHGYRQMWGIQTLKGMIEAGEFGEIISIEGKYWQSSTAQKAAEKSSKNNSWKNIESLSGPYDVLLDLGCHWADAAVFLLGESPVSASRWLSYVNAEAPHRDSHVHLEMAFPKGTRALASISKTVHGATNSFEINIIGSRKSAGWKFLNPDCLEIGQGSSFMILSRNQTDSGARHAAFHTLGWLDGYIEIFYQAFSALEDPSSFKYPTLKEHLDVLTILLDAQEKG